MTKFSLKPLTETSWILISNGSRVGLVSQLDEKLKVIGPISPGIHDDMQSLATSLGGKITIEQPIELAPEKEQGSVGGYPIKHTEWFNILEDPVPSYTRTSKSENRYAAGYYGLRFPNGWTQSFCPKLVTLTEYEYIGPFTTKLEMQHQISSRNKTINV
jgi:hypothetical protein